MYQSLHVSNGMKATQHFISRVIVGFSLHGRYMIRTYWNVIRKQTQVLLHHFCHIGFSIVNKSFCKMRHCSIHISEVNKVYILC